MTSAKEPIYDWHNHHQVLCEPRTGPIEERIAYISGHKPPAEIETRLRLLHPVVGKLPEAVMTAGAAYAKAEAKAWDAYDKTWAAYKAWAATANAYAKARDAYAKAEDAYAKVLTDNKEAIEALHKVECPDCPWDGRTIFPGEKP